MPRPAGGITINHFRARKEAVRAGAGVTILPNFTVRDELQNKTLKVLRVKEGQLPETQLMIVEARGRAANGNIERVKKAIEEKLTVGSRQRETVYPRHTIHSRG